MASVQQILQQLGIQASNPGACGKNWIDTSSGGELVSLNPATGEPIASVRMASEADYDRLAAETHETFLKWRMLRAPKRGEIVGQIGEELRANREEFGALVTLEMGMTITAVRGHGRQKGHKEVYRGIPGGPAAKGEGGDGGRR